MHRERKHSGASNNSYDSNKFRKLQQPYYTSLKFSKARIYPPLIGYPHYHSGKKNPLILRIWLLICGVLFSSMMF